MSTVLQHTETKLYVSAHGGWDAEVSQALVFSNFFTALLYAIRGHLSKVSVVEHCGDKIRIVGGTR